MPDGPYVSKEWNLASKIQYMFMDLPCDNVLSYIGSEFIANKISFQLNNPILPNQPITNRGIITSLILAPNVLLWGRPSSVTGTLPLLHYYGNWPNTFLLFSNMNYNIFLGGYLALEAFFIAIIYVEIGKRKHVNSNVFLLLFFTNYFILSQLVFAWPKLFTGFILTLIYLILSSNTRNPKEGMGYSIFLAALSIYFHPLGYYVIIFTVVLIIYYKLIKSKLKIGDGAFLLTKTNIYFAGLGLVLILLELFRPRIMNIIPNMYQQNNSMKLGILNIIVKIKSAVHSMLVFFPFSFSKFKTYGWNTYVGSLLIITIPVIFNSIKKWIVVNCIAILSFFAICFAFEGVVPAFILGMQFILPLLILIIASLAKNRTAIYIAVLLQLILSLYFVVGLFATGRINLEALLQLCLFLLFAMTLWAILETKGKKIFHQ